MKRRLLFPLLCVLLAVMAWNYRSQAQAFYAVLGSARSAPLLLAVLFQGGTLLNQPAFFQALYELVGIEARWRDLAAVVLAGRFLNVVTPAAGLGETALLFEQAKRRGWNYGKVTLATTLYFVLNFAVFALILAVALASLWRRGHLAESEVTAAVALFLGLAVGLVALLWLARKPASFTACVQSLAARLPLRWQRGALQPSSLSATALEFAASLVTLRNGRARFCRPVLHALFVDGLEMAVLGACLLAFGVAVTPPLVLVAYAVGTLFTVVSVSPQGLGAVEGAMTATLCSLGISLPTATAVVVAYRGLSFWLPLGIGFVATRFWAENLTRPGCSAEASKIAGSVMLPFSP